MSDGVTGTIDRTAILAALAAFGARADTLCLAAASVTADNIVREAKARLQRQLGPDATGQTVSQIHAELNTGKNGYVVLSDRDPMPNLPLWLEKGTKRGKPRSHTSPARPYFYVSALLEEGAHWQRLADAVTQAAADQGLGD